MCMTYNLCIGTSVLFVVLKPTTCFNVHSPNRLGARVKSKGFAFRHHGVPRDQVSSTDNECVVVLCVGVGGGVNH